MKKLVVLAVLVPALAPVLAAHDHGSAHGEPGLVVDSIISGGPAEAAGLRAGDRLLRLAGSAAVTMDDLQRASAAHRPGDTVPLVVRREGDEVELALTFGEKPDGGVSIGVRLQVIPAVGDGVELTRGTTDCLARIDKTYRIEPLMRELGLDLAQDHAALLRCIRRDTQQLTSDKAVLYCDNIFKVHCSGVSLLAEIGEALADRCETLLEGDLAADPKRHDAWRTCGRDRVNELYATGGESTDVAACKAVLAECSR